MQAQLLIISQAPCRSSGGSLTLQAMHILLFAAASQTTALLIERRNSRLVDWLMYYVQMSINSHDICRTCM